MSERDTRFRDWIARPQSIIALAALLLSVCGVFVALYEAALVRRQQRASVWPYVEVSASVTGERVQIWVENVGVGPARVHAAAIAYDGALRRDWGELLLAVDPQIERIHAYTSLVQGRVLPRDSEPEVIFRLTAGEDPQRVELVRELGRRVLDGEVDVTVCYCSVFDECWTSSLQALFDRSRPHGTAGAEQAVESCDGLPRSAI